MFHSHDNWFWERLGDGSVRVTKRAMPPGGWGAGPVAWATLPIEAEHVLPPGSWASIVAHVSSQGETADTYEAALRFHG